MNVLVQTPILRWASARITRAFLTLLFVTVAIVPGGCGMLPESSFSLSPESRLPKWYTLPGGLSRQQIQLRLDYLAAPGGRTAKFTVLGPTGAILAAEEGRLLLAGPWSKRGTSASEKPEYPLYELVEVRGVRDLIEHRAMEPTFYFSDEQAVWAVLAPAKPEPQGD